MGLHASEILVGYLAGSPGLFGLLELAPDRGRVTQLSFSMIMEYLWQLRYPSWRQGFKEELA